MKWNWCGLIFALSLTVGCDSGDQPESVSRNVSDPVAVKNGLPEGAFQPAETDEIVQFLSMSDEELKASLLASDPQAKIQSPLNYTKVLDIIKKYHDDMERRKTMARDQDADKDVQSTTSPFDPNSPEAQGRDQLLQFARNLTDEELEGVVETYREDLRKIRDDQSGGKSEEEPSDKGGSKSIPDQS